MVLRDSFQSDVQRKFLVNLVILLTLNLLIKPFYIFGIDRSVQNAVGAQNYGLYYAVFNFAFLFGMLLDCGITNYNNRHIARYTHMLPRYFSGVVALRLILGVIFTVVVFFAAWLAGYGKEHFHLLVWVGFNQFLSSFLLYLRSNISGLQMFKTDSVLSVLDRLLMIAVCSLLLWGNITDKPFKIHWFVYAQTFSYGITVLMAFVLCARFAGFQKLSFRLSFFRLIIKESFPFALIVLLTSFAIPIGVVLLERILGGNAGQVQSGIYAASYRILDAAIMVGYLVSVLLLPMFSKLIAEKKDIKELAFTAVNFLFVFSVGAAVWISHYATDWMNLLYVNQVQETAQVFHVLIFSLIPASLSYVFGTLLTANGNMKALNLIAGGGTVLMFGLSMALVPYYEALGSAYANVCVQCFLVLQQMIVAFKIFRWKCDFRYLGRLLAFGVLLLFGVYLIRYSPLHWLWNFTIGIAYTLVVAFALRLWDRALLQGLFSKSSKVRP